MVKLIAFFFLFEILKCWGENEILLNRLERIIIYKICDESTINGLLNYDQQFLSEIEKCDQILDTKVSKFQIFQSFK
jgi:hypothetical protein